MTTSQYLVLNIAVVPLLHIRRLYLSIKYRLTSGIGVLSAPVEVVGIGVLRCSFPVLLRVDRKYIDLAFRGPHMAIKSGRAE